MSKYFANRSSVCNLIAAILMIVLLVLQFFPFWQYGEAQEHSASIQGYIWFPSHHTDLEKYFAAETGSAFEINSILSMPILVLLTGIIGAIVCLIKADEFWVGILPVACGASGLWGFLTKVVYRMGTNWQLHAAVCVALILVGTAGIYLGIKDRKSL